MPGLHASHPGIVCMKQRASHTVYWSGLTGDIEDTVRGCQICQERLPAQQNEPMWIDENKVEERFEEVSLELFESGRKFYLVLIDQYTGYPFIHGWDRCPTTKKVIESVQPIFAMFGRPSRCRSNGGPQFKSKESGPSLFPIEG